MKEVWVNNKDLEGIAKQYGVSRVSDESKVYIITPETNLNELPVGIDYLFVEFTDWSAIPAENLIAKYSSSKTKIIVKTDSVEDLKKLSTALQHGVDGFLVSQEDSLKTFCDYFKPSNKLDLMDAEVTNITDVKRLSKRVCIDGVSSYNSNEGALIGWLTNFMFLVDAETTENPYVNTRDWRVNAGSAGQFVLFSNKLGIISPKVLEDLVSGDEIIATDSEGNIWSQKIGRLKKEMRPVVFIEAEYEGKRGTVSLQNAETIKLVTSSGTIPVTNLKVGDMIKAYIPDSIATHFGMPINEYMVEK